MLLSDSNGGALGAHECGQVMVVPYPRVGGPNAKAEAAAADYTTDPRLSKVPFMTLKKAIVAKVGSNKEAKDAIFHSSSRFALAQLATTYEVDITDLLNAVGSFEEFAAQAAKEAEAKAAAAARPAGDAQARAEMEAEAKAATAREGVAAKSKPSDEVENARLRADVDRLHAENVWLHAENVRLRAEVSRLQAEKEPNATLHPVAPDLPPGPQPQTSSPDGVAEMKSKAEASAEAEAKVKEEAEAKAAAERAGAEEAAAAARAKA